MLGSNKIIKVYIYTYLTSIYIKIILLFSTIVALAYFIIGEKLRGKRSDNFKSYIVSLLYPSNPPWLEAARKECRGTSQLVSLLWSIFICEDCLGQATVHMKCKKVTGSISHNKTMANEVNFLVDHMFIYLFNLLILEKERKGKREIFICCSTYLCLHWLFLVCAVTRVQPTTFVYQDKSPTNCATQPGPPSYYFWENKFVKHSSMICTKKLSVLHFEYI